MLPELLHTFHQQWFVELFFAAFAGIFLLAAAYEVRNVSHSLAAAICLALALLSALLAVAFHFL